jgi:hypothetical protein
MRIGYLTGVIPNKSITKVLIEIEQCPDSTNDFDRQVFNKDYATYSINKFKIKNIIDELCNKYTVFKFHKYDDVEYKIDDIVEKKIYCYFTPKAALSDFIYNEVKKTYYPDGEIKEKIYYDKNKNKNILKQKIYYTNGNKKHLINYRGSYNFKHGDYKEWTCDGLLIKYYIYENDIMIKNVLYDDITNLTTIIENEINKPSEYNKNNKSIFVKNLKKILNLISSTTDKICKIKYIIMLFNYLGVPIGTEIIKEISNLRKIIKGKIVEFFQDNTVIQLSISADDNDLKLYEKFSKSLININNKITEIEK